QVYIYDDFGPDYNDVGFKTAVCAQDSADGCSTSFRVSDGGFHRWQLMVENPGGNRTHAVASITVTPPFPLLEVVGGGFVDMLAPASRSIAWLPDPRNDWDDNNVDAAWVEMRGSNSLIWNPGHYPRVGSGASFTVPESELSAPGQVRYSLRDCYLPRDSDTKLCSPEKSVGFIVGSDRFLGHNPVQPESGSDLEISFTTYSGNVRLLSSPTLISGDGGWPIAATSGNSYLIDGKLLSPGLHRIELVSCDWKTSTCSNRQDAERAASAGYLRQEPAGYYHQGELIATLTPQEASQDGSPPQAIYAPADGEVHFTSADSVRTVEAGELIAYSITRNSDVLYIQVDSRMDWTLHRPYTDDFYPGKAYPVIGGGQPLDTTYGPNGGIWLLNEFSSSIEHMTAQRKVESINIPLARNRLSQSSAFEAVKPFLLSLANAGSYPASISSLAERATRIGPTIWFTQGGGLMAAPASDNNHSRIISYDPRLADSPLTPYDDRICVYNLPADDTEGFGDNQVIGLTAASGRIWVAESRGLFSDERSSISSFVPHKRLCANLLNFADPDALASQKLQYCAEGRTPEQDGCMQRLMPGYLPDDLKIAHLEADPEDDSIWFSDARGAFLGHLLPAQDNRFELFRLPDSHSGPLEGMHGFGGFPWNLRVDNDAVYIGEYATAHILRFDKTSATFDEVLLPCATSQVTLHSLAIDPVKDRLWFTLANESWAPIAGTASTIGYMDLASWRDYLAEPRGSDTVSGVIYQGLDSIPASPAHPDEHHAFRGIAIDPRSGNIALATMWRRQLIELVPHSGF
ncbi:MAG: hypothetical protein V2I26_10930, partial [Halieaceae bacterium]|nr:hypothetical protein [Halieaceae bacterium]